MLSVLLLSLSLSLFVFGPTTVITLKHVVRLVLVHVQRCRSDATVFESLRQSRFVDQTASGRVDEERAWSHLFDRVLVDQMVIVLVQSAVQGDAIRLEQ